MSKYSIGFFAGFPAAMAVDGVPADIGWRKNGYLFVVPGQGWTCCAGTSTCSSSAAAR